MGAELLADLHAPLLPILHHILAQAALPRAGLALDLACGSGLKAPLLAAACGPGVRLIGIDIDHGAIRAATTNHRRPTAKHEQISSVVSRRSSVVGIVGDALALPLRGGCCATAFCIAALSLFADRRAALCELRRVLAPGSVALLVVGAQAWAQAIHWPTDLSARLAGTYAQALAEGHAPLPATPDLGGELAELLLDAGFAAPLVRAFRLDQSPATDHRPSTVDSALAAELPLLPWQALRPLLAGRLAAAEFEHCDALADEPEIELCMLALTALAHVA
jgi:SAM-dependent methyltransferase